jgi:hypothetical protein
MDQMKERMASQSAKMKETLKSVVGGDEAKYHKEEKQYFSEQAFMQWMVFTMALCSGVFLEAPVIDRQNGVR